jgi:hypothetical protein
MSEAGPQDLLKVLDSLLPTAETLDRLFLEEARARQSLPVVNGRLAAPYKFDLNGGNIQRATFEIYEVESPLGELSAWLYRTFLEHPASQTTQSLTLGNVACQDFYSSQRLGDGVALLARAGLPPRLEVLCLERIGPVTNAGDMGFYPTEPLSPLLEKLKNLSELQISGCDSLGKFDLPNLRTLHLHAHVSSKNLKELARANLPLLERLDLSCDLFADNENRFKALQSLLRSKKMPRLRHLVLQELDLNEDERLELDDGEEAEGEPDSWVDMIADSLILKRLESLELWFRDDERELPTLITRAEAFEHLEMLEFWGGKERVKLRHPTQEMIRAALGR